MKGKIVLSVLFFITAIVMVSPLFAEDAVDENVIPAEDVMAVDSEDEGVVTGEVLSLTADTITVKAEDGEVKTFSVIEGETILWKGIDDITLADVKQGETAEVGYYTDETGNLVGSWVDILVEEESGETVTEE
jgi:hypothetical protein